MNNLGKRIQLWRESKGFITPSTISDVDWTGPVTDGDMMIGKLMLVVTEVSEAAEAVRSNDLKNFGEELADVFIRLLDICATTGIDIKAAIDAKMKINEQRAYKHGRQSNL